MRNDKLKIKYSHLPKLSHGWKNSIYLWTRHILIFTKYQSFILLTHEFVDYKTKKTIKNHTRKMENNKLRHAITSPFDDYNTTKVWILSFYFYRSG